VTDAPPTALVDGTVVPLAAIAARIEPYDWAFPRECRAAIDAHWTRATAGKPAMFNGRVLLQHRAALLGDRLSAAYFAVDYADFLAWRDFGPPAPKLRNGFAMAALRARDGAFLMGRMGEQTANPGQVYFAAGTPDLGDVRPDGSLDLAGSVTRELFEETGLGDGEVTVEESWLAVVVPGRVALMRPVHIDLPAEEARALMLDRIMAQAEPELADIVIIRSTADAARHLMPGFMKLYLAQTCRA